MTAGLFGVVASAVVGTTVAGAIGLTFLSVSSCVTFTSPSFASGLSKSTSHVPSGFTVVVFVSPFGNVTTILDPATPVPVTFRSSVSTLSTVGFADVSFSATVLVPGIVSFDLSGYVIVTSPLSSTVTVVPAGRLGLAFLTSSTTLSFSSCVSWAGLSTFVTAGLFGVVASAVVGTTVVGAIGLTFLSVSSCVTFTSPSFASGLSRSTSHLPSGFTVVVFVSPFGNVTTILDPATPVPVILVSSVSTLSTVGFTDVSFSATVSVAGITPIWSSGYLISTRPSSFTVTVVSAGNVGFASFTAFSTFPFSSSVSWVGLSTFVIVGFFVGVNVHVPIKLSTSFPTIPLSLSYPWNVHSPLFTPSYIYF